MVEKLAYVGKIIKLEPIEGADNIVSATVVCGEGGRWRGVVHKKVFSAGDKCLVCLPDCIVPQTEEFKFMEKHKWLVRMARFKGAPSEVLIVPLEHDFMPIGYDASAFIGVERFFKPIPANLQGEDIGGFPSFIPKTDELNYQAHFDLVDKLHGNNYYVTEKADGSSTTAFNREGYFGLCSRNVELKKNYDNGYWKVAQKYKVEERLPNGIALQWETVGPKIQGNPMGFTEVDGRAFSAYDIYNRHYLHMDELMSLCKFIDFPMVKVLDVGDKFNKAGVETLGEGKYDSGKEREGVVVRSQGNSFGDHPISFKVINLNYAA